MGTHGRTLSGIVSRLVSAIRARHMRHHTRRHAIRGLRRMSDPRLADIGIARHRIPEVVDGLIAQKTTKHEGLRDPQGRRADCPTAVFRTVAPV